MTPATSSHAKANGNTKRFRPLAGVRVIDASRVLAGPYCGSLLADLGADVIRLEHPTLRDEVRTWLPRVDDMSAAFIALNRGKRGIALDLAQAEGVAVFRKMLSASDVLLENFRPGMLDRIGLTREAITSINPALIHCAVRAFAKGTSNEDLPGYEASMQAFTGIMSITGEPDANPVRCGVSVIDIGTGLVAVSAILSALRVRDQGGGGQYVEPSLMRSATHFLNYQIAGISLANAHPQRYGSGHELLVPYRVFQSANGPLFIAAGNDKLWELLCDVLALRDGDGSVRYPTLAERVAARDTVNSMVADAVRARSRGELWDTLKAAGIPSAPVNTVAEYLADATLWDAGVLSQSDIPGLKAVDIPGAIFAAAGFDPPRTPPPRVGEHTDDVLTALGYAQGEIDALRTRGVVK
jgi:formyl-CoA transferase/CoA:oxalate CoA-transferase